jgi:hypothetical protein
VCVCVGGGESERERHEMHDRVLFLNGQSKDNHIIT